MDAQYMVRCIELAKSGAGNVAPNPMVGALLVYDNRIIGEGYHQQYGGPHAEVNCINSVSDEDYDLLNSSTLYVSLEPCSHFGKTPPCTDLIIEKKIPKVVIGCSDSFKEVDGKGIEKLEKAGVEVLTGVLENACTDLNKRFFTFHAQHRPYIILKWAQTNNAKIASMTTERLLISNEYTNRLVHKWRSEEASVLVGTNTAFLDDPGLTNRLWYGNNPVRLVVDMNLRLPSSLKIFNETAPTIVFNQYKHAMDGFIFLPRGKYEIKYYQVAADASLVHQVLNACYRQNIQSILVEGGATLLQSFIDEGLWDEARIITNETLKINRGLPAPELTDFKIMRTEKIFSDRIDYYSNSAQL